MARSDLCRGRRLGAEAARSYYCNIRTSAPNLYDTALGEFEDVSFAAMGHYDWMDFAGDWMTESGDIPLAVCEAAEQGHTEAERYLAMQLGQTAGGTLCQLQFESEYRVARPEAIYDTSHCGWQELAVSRTGCS